MDQSDCGQIEMPRYISCKPVWALKIADIEPHNGGHWLHFEDAGYAHRWVGPGWVEKRGAQVGGWMVQYADSYLSFSPDEPFTAGNVPAREWGIPRTQEPKYGVNMKGRLFNRATGREVDEPFFVLRAQDRRALDILVEYRRRIPIADTATTAALDAVIASFIEFRRQHPERTKEGDSKAPPPPAPFSMNNPQRWSQGEREGREFT